MTEREEKKIEKKEEGKKSSVFFKWKKLATAGLIGLSFLGPVRGIDAYPFPHARDPPKDEWGEQIKKKYPKQWIYTIITDRLLGKGEKSNYVNKSIEDYKRIYEETKDDDALYMWVYSYYQKAINSNTIEEVEENIKTLIQITHYPVENHQIKEELYALRYWAYADLIESYFREYKKNGKQEFIEKIKKIGKEAINDYNENKDVFDEEGKTYAEQNKNGFINRINVILDKLNLN